MGKPKLTSERVKGNLKPSSSSRAAELLGSKGLSTGVPVGLTFSSFSTSSSPSDSASETTSVESWGSLKGELVVIIRKLAKRNSTTKIKALEELQSYLSQSDSNELVTFLPIWSGFYTRLSGDLERKVRLLAQQLLGFILKGAGKQAGPHLKPIMGAWSLSFFDPSKEVAEVANSTFKQLFTPEKQTKVLNFAQADIVSHLTTSLTVQTRESVSDARFYSEEEMEQRFARLVSCSLLSLGMLLERLTLTDRQEMGEAYHKLLDDPKVIGFFSNKTASIRRAAYCLMTGLVLHDPDFVKPRVPSFASSFLNRALLEKEYSCLAASLDALVVFTKEFPDLWLVTKKPSFPKFIQLVDFVVNHKDNRFHKLIKPVLPVLVNHFPIELLNKNHLEALLEKVAPIHHPNYLDWQDLSSWVPVASDTVISLTDKLKNSQLAGYTGYTDFLTTYSIQLVSRFLFSTACITVDDAATLLLKVLSWFCVRNSDAVDDYVSEIEVLLTDSLFSENPTSDDGSTSMIRNRSIAVDLLANLIFQKRQFAKDNSSLIQNKLRGVLNRFITISLEKLQAEQPLPGTVTYSESSCFSLLCTITRKLYSDLDEPTQHRLNEFFLHHFFPLMSKYNLSQGLDTLDNLLTNPNIPSNLAKSLFDQLSDYAALPTDQLPYPIKLDFVNFLCKKALVDPTQTTIPSAIKHWMLSVANNLILSPEVNNSIQSSERLETLISFVLIAPASLLDSEFYSSFLDSLNPIVNRYTDKLPNCQTQSDQTHETILFARLENLVHLISRAIIGMLQHPSSDHGLDRLVNSHATFLAQLIHLNSSNVLPVWLAHLPTFSSNSVEPVMYGYFGLIQTEVLQADSAERTIQLAEAVSSTVHGLSNSGWKHSDLSCLLSSVCPNTLTWQLAWMQLLEKHAISAHALTLSYFSGWISSLGCPSDFDLSKTESKDSLLPNLMSFSYALIHNLNALSIQPCSTIAHVFTTEVLFSWLECVLSGSLDELVFYLELDPSVWNLLEKAGLNWDLTLSPYLPPIVTEMDRITAGVLGLNSLAIQLLWLHGLNSCPPSDSWQTWSVDYATNNPKLGHVLIHGLAFYFRANSDACPILSNFLNELVNQLCSTPASEMVSLCGKEFLLEEPAFYRMVLIHNLLDLPLTSSRRLELHYWGLTVLEQADLALLNEPVPEPEPVPFWGVFLPIINYTCLYSNRHASDPTNFNSGTSSDDSAQGGLSSGLLVKVIGLLLEAEPTPEGYFLKTNALILFKTLLTQGIISPASSECCSADQNHPVKLVLDQLLAEHLDGKHVDPTQLIYLQHLGQCVSLISRQSKVPCLPSFAQACMLLHSPHPAICCCAAQLGYAVLPDHIEKIELDLKKENSPPPRLPLSLLTLGQELGQGARVTGESPLIFNQLLAWLVILYAIELSSYELRGLLSAQIESSGGIQVLMTMLLDSLNLDSKPFDCGNWDITEVIAENLEATAYPGIPLLAAHVYLKLLKNLPSLIRTWWNERSNRNVIANVESYTQKHFSNLINAVILEQVKDVGLKVKLCDEQFSYKVVRSEVTATYDLDDNPISMVFRLPSTYPLKQPEITGLEHVGVPEKRWRSWILGSNSVLVSRNGTLIDAIEQFKRNATSHFAGQPDCMICYSMVSVIDRSLPNRTCRTCRNKFHSACLYKWIQSSSQSTCPLCRNLF